MSTPPEVLSEVCRRVEKAENDLRNAGYVLGLADDCPTDTVCFHCQQCAEKYLKALLIFRGVDFPRTHDLVVLLNLASGGGWPALDAGQVQTLNRYSVEGRYPGDWDPIDLQEAGKALETAKRVRAAVRGMLPPEALP